MQLSVIIINYNVKYFLEQCLHAVHKAMQGIDGEVLVADNHSADGSEEYLPKKFPWVKFYWQKENPGFGKANNRMLHKAAGDYVLFLNPDTIVAEDSFALCLEYFSTHKDCGALGVRMIDGTGKFLKESKRGLPTPAASFFKMSGLAALLPGSGLFAKYYAGHLSATEVSEVDVLAGAFFMMSRKAVELTKGFDEDFFMYGEDVDLSYRITKAGLRNIYFPKTTIIHFKGESTQRLSPAYIKHFYGAMMLFVQKHFAGNKFSLRLMKFGIGLRMMMARAQQPPVSKTKNVAQLSTAVVAGQHRFTETVHLLKHASPPVVLVGRISVLKSDGFPAICQVSELNQCIKEKKIKQLVLCQGQMSFKELIKLAQELKRPVRLLFHAGESQSIVGSPQKNGRGVVIAALPAAVAGTIPEQ